ncbi:MAG: hypothetical protein QM760_01630 [Nibricoccus sp.]
MIAGSATGFARPTAIKTSQTAELHTFAKNKTGSTAFSRTAYSVERLVAPEERRPKPDWRGSNA